MLLFKKLTWLQHSVLYPGSKGINLLACFLKSYNSEFVKASNKLLSTLMEVFVTVTRFAVSNPSSFC